MATGYIVAPISKLPFLNIMTDVLLTHVPAEIRRRDDKRSADWSESELQQQVFNLLISNKIKHQTSTDHGVSAPSTVISLTLWKY